MGIILSPLSTIALSEIPKQKIAQASGLFNVIRQIGGSFGVAIFGCLLTRRDILHTANFGAAVNQYSPTFQDIAYKMNGFVHSVSGGTMAETAMKAKTLIGAHVAQQAFVQAINDDYFIAAVVTLLALVPILFLRTHKKPKTIIATEKPS
jgi:DHA2 family multidrug resistance protein